MVYHIYFKITPPKPLIQILNIHKKNIFLELNNCIQREKDHYVRRRRVVGSKVWVMGEEGERDGAIYLMK